MPLIIESHDSLPYIDADPTPTQREHAQSLITAELAHIQPSPSFPTSSSSTASVDNDASHPPSTHPLLAPPPPQSPFLTPLHASELTRIASSKPLIGIDLSRYEQLDPPPTPALGPTAAHTTDTLAPWRTTLQKAYTAHTYLSTRTTALDSLLQSGKEDWLAGNATLVALLGTLEMELLRKNEAIDKIVVEREGAQRSVEGELTLLEEGWRKGVGKMLETEVAAEALRREVLRRRREGAR